MARTKVLIVDDDASIRHFLRVLLRMEGHHVVEAFDGLDACEKFEASPDFACIILDVSMPRLDGYGVLRRVRQHRGNADVAVILMTGQAGKKEEARAMSAGSDAYVTKPFDPDVLIGLIGVTLRFTPEHRAQARRESQHEWVPEIGDEWGRSNALQR